MGFLYLHQKELYLFRLQSGGTRKTPGEVNTMEKLTDQTPLRGSFSVRRFSGEDEEDVDEFLDAVHLSFMPQEILFKEAVHQEKARLLFMSSLLDGKARRWWRSVEKESKDTWTKVTALFKARFATKVGLLGGEINEWTRANAEFNVMEQGERTDNEYAGYVQELHTILGEPFGPALASKFVQGIKDPITRKIVHGQLDDKYSMSEVLKAFLRATRDDRTVQAQRQLQEKKEKEQGGRDFDLAKAVISSQENIAKMVVESNQKMVEMMTKAMGQVQLVKAGPQGVQATQAGTGQGGYNSAGRGRYGSYQGGGAGGFRGGGNAGYRAGGSQQTPPVQEINRGQTCYNCGAGGHISWECPECLGQPESRFKTTESHTTERTLLSGNYRADTTDT